MRRFARDHVDLQTNEVVAARRSRDYLIQQLQNGAGEFPPFTGEVRHFGSFARRTKIRPLDDIDLMVVLEGQGLTLAHTDGQETHLRPAQAQWPANFLNPQGYLNSRVVLNSIRRHLVRVLVYKESPMKATGQALALRLTTRPWTFDVVPAFAVTDLWTHEVLHYLIPNGRGAWMPTDPRRDTLSLREASQEVAGQLHSVIRLLKYWNRRGGKPRLGSYHLEVMAIEALTVTPFVTADPFDMLHACFVHISQRVLSLYPDPKGLEGPLDRTLTSEARQAISAAAWHAGEAIHTVLRHPHVITVSLPALRRVFGADISPWSPV